MASGSLTEKALVVIGGATGPGDGAAIFPLSEAARFVTGHVLAIDGGRMVSEGQTPPPTT